MASKLGLGRPFLSAPAAGFSRFQSCRYNSSLGASTFGATTLNPATDARIRSLNRRQVQAEKFERERAHDQRAIDLQKYQTREWKSGDVYSPRDISPGEMKKWKKGLPSTIDIFDALAINPLHLYKNVAVMSEFVSETGRIIPGKRTGLRRVNQRKLGKAIRRAVNLGLMPSVHRHPEILTFHQKL